MNVSDALGRAVVSPAKGRSTPPGAWFREARFGLFVHWGLYSLLGRGEWARNRERIPDEEYVALSDQFSAEAFDARAIADMAKRAGMRYGILTTKHHDGFCLWDSKVCGFNALHSAAGRDLVREFVEAFREAGLRVGLYYSLGDWHHPDWIRAVRGDEPARRRFVQYTRALVSELMSEYGRIDVLWYDLPQGLSADQWEAVSLNTMVRELQPGILINNRSMLAEDFSVREQSLHGAPEGRLWETCLTLNESWAYVEQDHEFKSPRQVVRSLARAAVGGGNLLLNVGPDGSGAIRYESSSVLAEVGAWCARNGEAIYGPGDHSMPFNLWGESLARGNDLFLFLLRYFGKEFVVGGLGPRVLDARVLGTDIRPVAHRRGNRTFITGMPETAPDPLLTVVKLTLDGPPSQDISEVIGGADIMASFPD